MSWVSWLKICKPKSLGGLGVKDLKCTSKALKAKWIWRYANEKKPLWRIVVQQKLKNEEEVSLPTNDDSAQGRSNWKGILKTTEFMEEHVSFKQNNGNSIRFWLDNWTNSGSLRSKCPAIYKACSRKNAYLCDMIVDGRLYCQVKRSLYHYEQLEYDLLCNELGLFQGINEEKYVVEIMGGFSVKKFYLVHEEVVCDFSKFLWKSGIPPKVSFLIWAIFHDLLPTYAMLSHRGMHFEDVRCPICKGEEETTDHIMLDCPFAFKVWSYFIKAFQISWVFPNTVKKNFESWRMTNLKGRCKQVWWKVIYAVHWKLWKERNNRDFGGRARDVDEVIMLIKQTIVVWFFDRDVSKDISVSQVLLHWDVVLHI